VFLTSKPPYRPLDASGGVSLIVKRRLKAGGIDVPGLAAHAFRHSLATRCLNEGHSLKDIADLLGHRQISSTFHYTKVDFQTLRPVALEWPEEVNS
jgi:site-specific recombinase XerD